jgi:TRAP-type C4-dicarboxylate transport system permease small subunit
VTALSQALNRFCFLLACVSVAAILVFTLAEIALRPFGISIVFVNELQGFLMVAVVFLALGDITTRREHMVADFFTSLLPDGIRSRFDLAFNVIASLAYVSMLIWVIGALAYSSYHDAVRSEGILRVPLVLPQLLIAIGLIVMLLALLVLVRRLFRQAKVTGAQSS